MIFPEPRKDHLNQRGIAFLSTLVLAVALYGILLISGISIQDANRVILREINLDGLLAQQLKLASVESSPSANTLSLLSAGQITSEEEENGVNESVEEQDEQTEDVSAQDPAPPQDLNPVEAPPVEEDPEPEPPPAAEEEVNDTQQVQEDSSPDPAPDEAPVRANVAQVPEEPDTNHNAAENTPLSDAGSGRVTIERKALAAFGADYKTLEIRGIINWMKANPAELPKGIRQLVRFRPAFLSSVTSFNMDGKDYELYLMCKESLFEVHVVLVDEDEAIYLVDRSFQKLSTYLRKGQVRRTEDQHIVAVRSNMASNASSDEFYALFLSWWDWAQVES